MTNRSIPHVSDAKRYGSSKEMAFAYYLQEELPDCKMKQNILIHTDDGNAEIDCLVLYKSKLFAIEVKSWKGNLSGNDEGIVQNKTDRWTDEIHTKYHKSPFKQITCPGIAASPIFLPISKVSSGEKLSNFLILVLPHFLRHRPKSLLLPVASHNDLSHHPHEVLSSN